MATKNNTDFPLAPPKMQSGWRRLMLHPSFYTYLVCSFFLLDALSIVLLYPIDLQSLDNTTIIELSFLLASITCIAIIPIIKNKIGLIYLVLVLTMIYPAVIISIGLLDVRFAVHYVPFAFLIQVGLQNKQLSYKAFISLTLIMVIFFLSVVFEPKLDVNETTIQVKTKIVISMFISAFLIFLDQVWQRARSYYITIEKKLVNQIGYVTTAFSKITSFKPTLGHILEEFKEKMEQFIDNTRSTILLDTTQSALEDTDYTNYHELLKSKNEFIKQVASTSRPIIVGNTETDTRSSQADKANLSFVMVPILTKDNVIGIIKITNPSSYYFNDSHLHLTEIIASLCSSKILEYQSREMSYQSLELELESQQLQELDDLKYNFIENISRDIESPIRSILEPSKKLIQEVNDQRAQKLLQLINSNGIQLKEILDQLLQLNDIDENAAKLNLERIDLGRLIHEWTKTFDLIAERKNITLSFAGPNSLRLLGDQKKLMSIVHNLINNALKYTPVDGRVMIDYGVTDNLFYLQVNDSGQGIPEEHRTKIFDRFFRLGEADGKGTGIGLSIVREFTEILGGTISVSKSDLGGASFQFSYNINFVEGIHPPNTSSEQEERIAVVTSDNPVILVVDDHNEMRQFICDCLEAEFTCIQADNGQKGLERAQRLIPDLIITDLMMPEMSGEELCSLIRADERLSHIPLVVLSAKSTGADKVSLYEIGADNYLVKPFEIDELKAVVHSLIQVRNQLREQFKSNFLDSPELEEIHENKEHSFIEKVIGIIMDNLDDHDFNIVMLCNKLKLGRNQVQRKIKALTDLTPVEFVRDIRLKEAAKLLKSTDQSISEIAYQTGFNNLSYFTKIFKQTFDKTPSDYRKV